MKVSVYTCCNDAIEQEATLFEGVFQALRFADEIIYVDGGSTDGTLEKVKEFALRESRIKIYENPWEDRMRKAATLIQKNVALSHCTGDWCLLLDADEVYGEDIVREIRKSIELANNGGRLAVYFKTLHFYADYKHTCFKDPIGDYNWYEGKIYAIRNNLGIHHGNADGDHDGFVYNDDKAISREETSRTNLTVFHYGHVRSLKVYLRKKNSIERRYHLNWKDLKEWGFAGVNDERYFRRFEGKHPEIMSERIKLQMPLKHEDVVEYYKKFLEEKWV